LVTYTSSTQEWRDSAASVFEMFRQGALKVSINQRYKIDDIARAHADLEAGRTTGSSLILPA